MNNFVLDCDDFVFFSNVSAHAITADIDIAETAKAAEYFLSDGVIVTGIATGSPADLEDLRSVQAAVKIPVLIGT
jgi:predicted TIM-barrel enzyme